VRQWLADLPPTYQLDMGAADAFHPGSSPPSALESPFGAGSGTGRSDAILAAQRCEIAITAHRLVLRLYVPFLRPGSGTPPHQASYATVNAAHMIVHASKVLCGVWRQHGPAKGLSKRFAVLSPAMFDLYSFGRTVFDAAVVCAHAAIKQPSTMWAGTALEDVSAALGIMRDPVVVGIGRKGGVEPVGGAVGEADAVRIVEIMKRKAEAARGGAVLGGVGGAFGAGLKRKHDQVEKEAVGGLLPGFEFQYDASAAGADMISPGAPQEYQLQHQQQQQQQQNQSPQRVSTSGEGGRAKFETHKGEKEKGSAKHAKKGHNGYPPVGIRVRTGKESPLVRQRTGSTSTTTTSSSGGGEGRMHAPPPLMLSTPRTPITDQVLTSSSVEMNYNQQQPPHPNHHQQQQQHPHPPSIPMTHVYRSRSPSINQDPRMHQQQPETSQNQVMDYASFGGSDNGQMNMHTLHRRRLSEHEQQQQQQPTPQHQAFGVHTPPMYDQARTASFDTRGFEPPRDSFDHERAGSYGPASSPYGGAATSSSGQPSTASSPYTATSGGAGPSSISTSTTFSPTSGMTTHHASPPTFGQPVSNASPQSYYLPTAFDPSYENPTLNGQTHAMPLVGLGMNPPMDGTTHNNSMAPSVPNTPLYEKPRQAMYDVKPPLPDLNQHHGSMQQSFQVGHDPVNPHQSQNHGMSMTPSQTWPAGPTQNVGEQNGQYWPTGFYQ